MKWKIPEGHYLVLKSKGGDDDLALARLNETNGIGKWESTTYMEPFEIELFLANKVP